MVLNHLNHFKQITSEEIMPSYDVMPDVQLFQPTEVEDAVSLANQYKEDGWILGGGQDT